MASTSTSTGGLTVTVTLPTKRHDGGEGGDKRRNVVGETQQDAFSRYSNDLLRLKAIMLSDKDEDNARDQADDDLDSLATINRALSSLGLRNLHLDQGQGHRNEDASKRRRGNHPRVLYSKAINARRDYLGKRIRACYFTRCCWSLMI